MRRYFRVEYGPEYFNWKGNTIEIEQDNFPGVLCQRYMFEISD